MITSPYKKGWREKEYTHLQPVWVDSPNAGPQNTYLTENRTFNRKCKINILFVQIIPPALILFQTNIFLVSNFGDPLWHYNSQNPAKEIILILTIIQSKPSHPLTLNALVTFVPKQHWICRLALERPKLTLSQFWPQLCKKAFQRLLQYKLRPLSMNWGL